MNGDINLNGIPLSRLSIEAKTLLSTLLNATKVIRHVGPDRISRYRDWRGLASLVDISSQIEASIKEYPDKLGKVLEIWLKKEPDATIGQLMSHLQVLDRYDVHDDLLELARNDKFIVSQPIRDVMIRADPSEDDIITFEDADHSSPQLYHAYVLYSPSDREFVDVLLAKLRENGLRMCTEDDLLPGFATRFEPVARLISERCRRIILVYSPDFFGSYALTFFTNIAQAHGIVSNMRNLVPIIYRPCELPLWLSHYHNLVYPRDVPAAAELFWLRLARTLDQQTRPRLPGISNGSVSSDSSEVRIQEVPAIVNGSVQDIQSATSPEPSSYSVTPQKDSQLLALPDVPTATPSGSVASLPSELQKELLPPYQLAPSSSTTNIASEDSHSKKKNRMGRFIDQVKTIPIRIGRKKKGVMAEG